MLTFRDTLAALLALNGRRVTVAAGPPYAVFVTGRLDGAAPISEPLNAHEAFYFDLDEGTGFLLLAHDFEGARETDGGGVEIALRDGLRLWIEEAEE
jgi:hypothetical protein